MGGLSTIEQLRLAGNIPGPVGGFSGLLGGAAAALFPQSSLSPTLPVPGGPGGMVPSGSLPVTAPPIQKMVNSAWPGYTVVRRAGQVFQVNTAWARMNGFKLPKKRATAPISAGEWKQLKTANRAKEKAKTIAGVAGFTCQTKGSARRRRK